ncbi:putative MFS multidrug transporter [Aspergillus novofumigatus IBT 16806]|uniref:Putative MFS multidrug transporter n=1 Tax=Aspergillus novofumigatus (strain IBT 16806) TaxID=1392255 RepID=A0A2I1BTV0_ASPN1|nr:putative MFS multidrug transporter [Aspergillus novofumigatus IBT 16806]PKX88721.1 putative MFS multidrug transporter [Aspergillus novofumigatus IBT 16806]
MVAEPQRDAVPSEATPLIEHPLTDHDETQISPSFLRGTVITITVGLLLFIQTTNISMLTTAQSDIAEDFDAFSETTWFSSAYLIAMSSVSPLAGRLCQIFTARIYTLFSVAILSVGLFITAASPSLPVFLFGRALSGCGSAGVMVTSFIFILDLTSKKRRGLFIGLLNVGVTTGISCGALLAGLLTPVFGWRLIFWVQAPASLILGLTLFRAIPSAKSTSMSLQSSSPWQRLAKVDYAGALTLATSVFLLLFSLASPNSTVTITPLILSFVSFAVFLLIESKFTSEPIIPIEVLKARSILATCLAALISMMARWSVLFFTPVYAMAVRQWSPASAGLILVPTNAGFGLGGLLVGWIHIRKTSSYYISTLIVFLLFALTNFILAILSTPSSPTIAYVVSTFFNGLFIGASMNYALSHMLHLTDPNVHYIVTSLLGMFRGSAGSFGSAIGGGFFQRELKKALEKGFGKHGLSGKDDLVRKLLGSPALVRNLSGLEKEVAIQSYEQAVKVLILGGCVLALVATMLQACTGWRAPHEVEKVVDDDLEDRLDRE